MASSTTETIPKEYTKRQGTSGIRGYLYETKLLSLIYFRAIHNDNIEEFHLATNVDNVGSFDDICFRAKVKGFDKPFVVFIQAKHRENNSVLNLNSKNDLVQYFCSYLEVRQKFQTNNEDVLFQGTLNDIECLFVIYTTAKGEKNSKIYEGSFAKPLNALIGTGNPGSQSSLDHSVLCEIYLFQAMKELARLMAMYINGEFHDSQMLMTKDLVICYHVILAQKVFDISEDQFEGHRNARFRQDFFDFISDEILGVFKAELCTEILKRRKYDKNTESCPANSLNECLFHSEVTDIEALYSHIKKEIIYKNGKFEFTHKFPPEQHKVILEKINYSKETRQRLIKLAMKESLPLLEFKVPASFGNKDLLIKGGDSRIERKLNDLTLKLVRLMKNSDPSDIVVIEESMGKGFLQLSGGIGSAVGNLLIQVDYLKLMKFNDNYESLGSLGKRLFDKLSCEIDNLQEYKFHVKATIFPKLSFTFDKDNEEVITDFSSKLLFFTSQYHEKDVEETLIQEINENQCDKDDVHIAEMTSNAIFLKYHDNIQKWWMTIKVGQYLTKEGGLYKNAVKHTRNQPLSSIINMMQRIKIENYIFNKDAENSIKLDDQPSGTVFITENSALTVAKLTKYLKIKNCVVLELKFFFDLSARDEKIIRKELRTMNKVKTLIFIFDHTLITKIFSRRLHELVNFMKDKNIIIVTDENSVEIAKEYFSPINNIIKDERNNLSDLSEKSQNSVLENTKIIFQGKEVSLNQIVDNESIKYVEGYVLNRIMQTKQCNMIGKSISNPSYNLKTFMQRKVKCFKVAVDDTKVEELGIIRITTLYSIADDVVLIIGDPGMGKSTLLTHISLTTKELYPTIWMLRINLLDHSKQFFEWKKQDTVIDTLESLKFLCRVALSEEHSNKNNLEITLKECDGNACIQDCTGDKWTVFELKMFLHYYNKKKLIFLFDGFDEICPTYANEVLQLINVLKNDHRKHKMWITSRSYEKMNSIIEMQFGKLYKIEPLPLHEHYSYLSRFWDDRKLLEDLNMNQFRNIYNFSIFMSENQYLLTLKEKKQFLIQSKKVMPFLRVYLSLVTYIKTRLRRLKKALDFKLYVKIKMALGKNSDSTYALPFNKFVATPLHLNLIADYLYDKIREINKKSFKWDLETNVFDIYESFIDTKLKRIRFQEKNLKDMYFTPDNISACEIIYKNTVDMHKKLGAYVVYDNYLFDENELKQLKEMAFNLKEGKEKTGIICNVVNDIPVFVHSTFADYFAVEYICDLLKSKADPKFIWNFILNVMFFGYNLNVLSMLDAKMKIDKELITFIEEDKPVIFELLMEQGKNTENEHDSIKSSLCEAIRHNLRHLGVLLFTTIKNNLNESKLMNFITLVKKTKILLMATKMEFEQIIVIIVNIVRMIDKSRLIVLFENIVSDENIDDVSTDELIRKVHEHVWMRMQIYPDWKNLAELSGQIYFI